LAVYIVLSVMHGHTNTKVTYMLTYFTDSPYR